MFTGNFRKDAGHGVRFESGIQQDIAGLPGQHQVLSTLVFEGNFRGLCRCEELFVEPGFKLMVKLRRRYPQFSGKVQGLGDAVNAT